MTELIAALIGGALGLVGAFFGVWLANKYESTKQEKALRRSITLDLYSEYHSAEILRARINVNRLLEARGQKVDPLPMFELREKISQSEWYDLGLVMTFLEKLSVYLVTDYIDRDLTRQLLGEEFCYWWDSYVERLINVSKVEDKSWAVMMKDAANRLTDRE